jgi:HPt (histidine-containing phosphotransfer) domain-containing protein
MINEIDLTYLRNVVLGNQQLFAEIIETFLEQTPEYLIKLKQALEEKNWHSFAKILHKAKPSFKTVGITHATTVIEAIEKALHNKPDADIILLNLNKLSQISEDSYGFLRQSVSTF